MKEYRAFHFRLYPTLEQQRLIHKTFGCVRFVYNYFLSCQKNGIKKSYDLCKKLKSLSNQYVFLKEVDSCALRCAIFNLEDAYKNFFTKRSGYPKYKSKYSYQSYRTNCIRSSYMGKEYNNIEFDMIAKTIKLPKLGKVKIRGYQNTKEIKGKYYYKINTYYPSSQVCSHCSYKNRNIRDLSLREYESSKCCFYNDRDINASINIKFEELKLHYKLQEIV